MDNAIILRFVTENDFVSWAIRKDCGGAPFSHVEFVLDDGTTLGAREKDGVQVRPASYLKPSSEERYIVDVTPRQKADVLAFAHAQVGKPYDLTAIMGILLERDWRERDSWFCSELVAAAFESAGKPILYSHARFKLNRITPQHVYLSPLMSEMCPPWPVAV